MPSLLKVGNCGADGIVGKRKGGIGSLAGSLPHARAAEQHRPGRVSISKHLPVLIHVAILDASVLEMCLF